MNIYGYVRVSTSNQNEDRQVKCMKELGIKNIFVEKCSGKNFERKKYKSLLHILEENDVLYIKSIDRLGRNYSEIIENWRILTKIKKVDVVVIDMPILDTRIGKDLMGNFISDLVLQILSFVAEKETVNIKERQMEGIRIAKEKGVKFGRPKKIFDEQFYVLLEQCRKYEFDKRELAKMYNVSISTIYRKLKEI